MLRRVTRVLLEAPRKIDIPERYGGEELAVLLDNIDVAQTKQVAEWIRIEISRVVVESQLSDAGCDPPRGRSSSQARDVDAQPNRPVLVRRRWTRASEVVD